VTIAVDGRPRCQWVSGGNELYHLYHDTEWGVPVRDEHKQFEFLILEGAQAGLSWATILNRREGYRRLFCDFDPERVARFGTRQIEALLKDPGIIRNRLKVASAVTNAQAFLRVQEQFGSFNDYIWGFVDGRPIQNRWINHHDLPATSTESDELSRDLRKRGFKFVGSTIMYAHMQATGMVNDHQVNCFRHGQCAAMA
jgi:DNA-3-methyladenine glycosylase I